MTASRMCYAARPCIDCGKILHPHRLPAQLRCADCSCRYHTRPKPPKIREALGGILGRGPRRDWYWRQLPYYRRQETRRRASYNALVAPTGTRRRWTPDEDALVLDDTLPDTVKAVMLGRTWHSIGDRRRRLTAPPVEYTCAHCGDTFARPDNYPQTPKFCSLVCANRERFLHASH